MSGRLETGVTNRAPYQCDHRIGPVFAAAVTDAGTFTAETEPEDRKRHFRKVGSIEGEAGNSTSSTRLNSENRSIDQKMMDFTFLSSTYGRTYMVFQNKIPPR